MLLVLLSSCSVVRRSGTDITKTTGTNVLIIDDVIDKNLTNRGFNIVRAEVEVENGEESQKFIASVKFNDGSYLVSLRSRAGIEAGRIFMTKDTILVNDRINRILYYGKPEHLRTLIGYPADLLPLVFGDLLVSEKRIDTLRCMENQSYSNQVYQGMRLKYVIDCRLKKVREIEQEGSYNGNENVISFIDFEKEQSVTFPKSIKITNNRSGMVIIVKIDKIEVPWNDVIEFIPGNNYEKKELR